MRIVMLICVCAIFIYGDTMPALSTDVFNKSPITKEKYYDDLSIANQRIIDTFSLSVNIFTAIFAVIAFIVAGTWWTNNQKVKNEIDKVNKAFDFHQNILNSKIENIKKENESNFNNLSGLINKYVDLAKEINNYESLKIWERIKEIKPSIPIIIEVLKKSHEVKDESRIKERLKEIYDLIQNEDNKRNTFGYF